MKNTHSHNNRADYIGIAGSVLCIVHCLVMPFLAFGSTVAHHEHVGFKALDFLFIIINALAVYYATRHHKLTSLQVLLWGALTIFSVSLVFEGKHSAFTWLSYMGSALLIIGHLINLYICQIAPRIKTRTL